MTTIEYDLKEYRLSIAKEQDLPPYCIFDDKTLIDLCNKLPIKKEQFVFVQGFRGLNTTRTENYADGIINLIKHYLQDNHISSPIDSLIDDYNLVIKEFIKEYNGLFKNKEIAEILTKAKYVKLLVSRLDNFYSAFKSNYYGILRGVKEDGIDYLVLKMVDENILKQDSEGFIYYNNF